MASSIQSRKAKGREHQKAIAKMIAACIEVEEEDVVSRPMGSGGEDLICSSLAKSRFPFGIECKAMKGFPGYTALEQSKANSGNNTPCVIWKPAGKNSLDSIIYFRFDDFLEMWKELLKGLNEKKD